MPSLSGRDSCPPVSRNLHSRPPARHDRRVGKSRMIQRALAVILAASVLPIAAGAAFDQPSPHGVYPGNPAAKIPAQRSALSSTERNDECNSVTLPGPLAAVASRAPAAEAKAE